MTITSPYPEVEIPDTGVYDYLFGELSDADADRVALVDAPTGTELTYRGLITRIDAFAAGLAGRGIGVGDVVGLLAPNSSGFAVAFHGILRAGATATTINALFTLIPCALFLCMVALLAIYKLNSRLVDSIARELASKREVRPEAGQLSPATPSALQE